MDFEQRLNQVADRYRSQGYKVVVRPGPEALPPFAKDFHVEILAERPDGNVLATAKRSRSEFEDDPDLPRYAEAIEQQPGWRYDVYVLGPEPQITPRVRDANEPSEQEIGASLDAIERMLDASFVPQALVAAWAVLEAAMRSRLRAEGGDAGWGSSPRTMLDELYATGLLPGAVFRELERLYQTRTAIVHGFTTSGIDAGAVRFLIDSARTLLEESRAARMTA